MEYLATHMYVEKQGNYCYNNGLVMCGTKALREAMKFICHFGPPWKTLSKPLISVGGIFTREKGLQFSAIFSSRSQCVKENQVDNDLYRYRNTGLCYRDTLYNFQIKISWHELHFLFSTSCLPVWRVSVSKWNPVSSTSTRGNGIPYLRLHRYCSSLLCPLLLTWFNFNPSMDK